MTLPEVTDLGPLPASESKFMGRARLHQTWYRSRVARQRGALLYRTGAALAWRFVDLSLSYPRWLELGKATGSGKVVDT